jgi:hypothetical protein
MDCFKMVRIDENQEVIARIRMYVDLQDETIAQELATMNEADGGGVPPPVTENNNHWAVGSPLRTIVISEFQEEHQSDSVFRNFEVALESFLCEVIDESDRPLPPYMVCTCFLFGNVG